VRDKLKITGFSVEDEGASADIPTADTIRRIWQDNRMPTRAGEVHKEVLKTGDAYVIVWPDAGGGVSINPNRASNCTVVYDAESQGSIVRAAKYWRAPDGRTRLNLFYPDRIEKYVSAKQADGWLPEAKEFVPLAEDGADISVVPNPFGVVPVFHFANNADIGLSGTSELEQAIPIQDGLNKSVLDMLVAMEFSAFRQRWAAGIEIDYDDEGKPVAPYQAGIDHLWVASNPDARFGDFDSANLEQFLKVKDSFRTDIASVTGTPLYYLMPQLRGFPSGESLRKAETRFLSKVRDRQESFGQVWSEVMSFAILAAKGRRVRLVTEWEDAASQSERELLENILLKKQIGISDEQALVEAGYGVSDASGMAAG
ncbi:MAG TPA: phage portal protein, partial [Pyrinomonadaceae bacterium]|nr:phage portal protein [Pyrinomonadaceae bacterium]